MTETGRLKSELKFCFVSTDVSLELWLRRKQTSAACKRETLSKFKHHTREDWKRSHRCPRRSFRSSPSPSGSCRTPGASFPSRTRTVTSFPASSGTEQTCRKADGTNVWVCRSVIDLREGTTHDLDRIKITLLLASRSSGTIWRSFSGRRWCVCRLRLHRRQWAAAYEWPHLQSRQEQKLIHKNLRTLRMQIKGIYSD